MPVSEAEFWALRLPPTTGRLLDSIQNLVLLGFRPGQQQDNGGPAPMDISRFETRGKTKGKGEQKGKSKSENSN